MSKAVNDSVSKIFPTDKGRNINNQYLTNEFLIYSTEVKIYLVFKNKLKSTHCGFNSNKQLQILHLFTILLVKKMSCII